MFRVLGGGQFQPSCKICSSNWMIFPVISWVFPKIRGKNPKWMVKIMENPIKIDDLGVPLFLETPT